MRKLAKMTMRRAWIAIVVLLAATAVVRGTADARSARCGPTSSDMHISDRVKDMRTTGIGCAAAYISASYVVNSARTIDVTTPGVVRFSAKVIGWIGPWTCGTRAWGDSGARFVCTAAILASRSRAAMTFRWTGQTGHRCAPFILNPGWKAARVGVTFNVACGDATAWISNATTSMENDLVPYKTRRNPYGTGPWLYYHYYDSGGRNDSSQPGDGPRFDCLRSQRIEGWQYLCIGRGASPEFYGWVEEPTGPGD